MSSSERSGYMRSSCNCRSISLPAFSKASCREAADDVEATITEPSTDDGMSTTADTTLQNTANPRRAERKTKRLQNRSLGRARQTKTWAPDHDALPARPPGSQERPFQGREEEAVEGVGRGLGAERGGWSLVGRLHGEGGEEGKRKGTGGEGRGWKGKGGGAPGAGAGKGASCRGLCGMTLRGSRTLAHPASRNAAASAI